MPQPKFSEGERILCYHGILIYEAKVRNNEKVNIRYNDQKNVHEYLVHYAGWNKSWDEWVPEDRVLKYNDENLKKKEQLEIENNKKKGIKKKSITPARVSKGENRRDEAEDTDSRSSTPNLDPRNRLKNDKKRESPSVEITKTKRSSSRQETADVEATSEKSDFKLDIPEELRNHIVDDFLFFQKFKRKMVFPAKITISQIIEEFKKETKPGDDCYSEILQGIKDIFNILIGLILYTCESETHKEMCDKKDPVDVYGSFHFVRLFLRYGEVWSMTQISEEGIHLSLPILHEILQFLVKNAERFFDKAMYFE